MFTLLTRLLLLISSVNALNILVWSLTVGQSHVNFMGNIADTLVEDGNNVTILMIENDPDVTSTGTRKVEHILRFRSPLVDPSEWSQHNFKRGNVFSTRTFELGDYLSMQNINYRICKSLISDSSLIQMLRSSRFDLAVVEMFHFCPAGILHLAGIPKIMMASALGMTPAHNELLRIEPQLSFVPAFMTHMGSQMSFIERVYNSLFHYSSKALYLRLYFMEQSLFNQKFPAFPDLAELYRTKMDYLLLNTNEMTESTRPTLSSVRYIGGSTTRDPEPLSEDFEAVLARGKKGTILFSLGSLVKSAEMPLHIRQGFLEAFRAMPDYEFIWKDDVQSNITSPNVHFRKWVPQVDLLADSRVKVFITHGGMNSIQEALLFGVPLVTMPIFADQDSNAALAAERGFSISLDKFTVNKEDILYALRRVLGNNGEPSPFTLQARQAARILRGSPAAMRREVQRLAQLSGKEPTLTHLKLSTDHLNWIEYHNLDVHALLVLLFTAVAIITVYLLNRFAFFSFSRK